MQKSLMHIQPSLIANGQPTEPVEPGKGALYYPPVPAQPLAAFHSSASYPRNDASAPQRFPAYSEVTPFVCMQLYRPPAAASPAELLFDWLDGVNHFNKHLAIMDIGRRADYRKRNSLPVDHNMALRARFSFIRRIRPGCFA